MYLFIPLDFNESIFIPIYIYIYIRKIRQTDMIMLFFKLFYFIYADEQ